MKHGSLFSGIGGFDLAAEWMGWDNIFHCEWMPFPRKVLSHYWPEAISYHDIATTDFRQHYGQIDILTGGFPCQPYSAAGKRKGKDDDRHLWPHMLRCIREVKPRWVVGENVFGLATWNGGLVFEEVCVDLEAEGYSVQPFVLPAAAVNAPHRRDRVWFVANAVGTGARGNGFKVSYEGWGASKNRSEGLRQVHGQTCPSRLDSAGENGFTPYANDAGTDEYMSSKRARKTSDGDQRFSQSEYRANGCDGNASNTDLHGFQQRNSDNEEYTSQGRQYAQRDTKQSYGDGDAADAESAGSEGQCEYRQRQVQFNGRNSRTIPANWQDFPTQSPICGGDDGLPTKLDGITFPKWRAESIKGYGNAIVPQVALQIFKAIQQYEAL